jgi:hypothetical protein
VRLCLTAQLSKAQQAAMMGGDEMAAIHSEDCEDFGDETLCSCSQRRIDRLCERLITAEERNKELGAKLASVGGEG